MLWDAAKVILHATDTFSAILNSGIYVQITYLKN